MFKVNIYIETSLKGPGKRKGCYASVIEYQKRNGEMHKRMDVGIEEKTTYHRSVLLALLKSLNRLNTSSDLTIYTDSTYLIFSVERGRLQHWSENGFISAKKKEIANKEEWQQVDRLLKGHKVRFYYVKEHKYSSELKEKCQIDR